MNPVIVSCGWDKVVKVSGSTVAPVTPPLRLMLSYLYLLLQRAHAL